MYILVTGGSGYIGSHTVVELMRHGHNVVILDNFSNSSPEVITRLEQITGKPITLYRGNVQDARLLKKIFREHHFDAVIHFAGLKSVGESVREPLRYYQENIGTSLALCAAMQEADVKKLIFSSSAVVYGTPEALPLRETSPTGINLQNPYAQTKYIIEQVLCDLVSSDPAMSITALRYFNPIGAHESGTIGEDPNGIPNNLLPVISQVAVGKLKKLRIFGNDYGTPDGTGIRDYVHVVDVAKGHVAALEHFSPAGTFEVYNLGTGKGVSVFDIMHTFEKISGKSIDYQIEGRRPGDVAQCYSDPSKAQRDLRWRAKKTLEEACADSWRWQSRNPHGYAPETAIVRV